MFDSSEYLILLHGDCYTLLKDDLQKYFSVKGFEVQRTLTRTVELFQSPLTRKYMPVELKLKREETSQCVVVKKYDEKILNTTNEKEYHRMLLILSWSPSANAKLATLISNLQGDKNNFPGEIVVKITQAQKPETKLELKSQFPDINIIRDDKELFAFFDEIFDL